MRLYGPFPEKVNSQNSNLAHISDALQKVALD